ncbi:hypothetical protein [Streptomyces sp. NPDC059165]|uniref:hypothetical protein n=1 Tax=Streptomyces sp. NPDC059165 TaxID=3346751 RepID=UPI00369074A1
MNAAQAMHLAAQARADAIVAALTEADDGGPRLRVSITDVATGQRLATGFVNYQADAPTLRLVTS